MIKTLRLPRLPHITIWLLLILISCSEKEKKAPDPVDVQVLNIQNIDNRPSLKLEGEIVAYSRHELSFLVAGRIIKLNVKEGDAVEKGQEIAILDDSDYLEALKIAKSKLDEANDQYQRLSNMYAAGSLPEADFKKIKLSC